MDDPTYITDDSVGYRLHLTPTCDTLLCTFGGMWLPGATPGFQFVNLTRDWDVKKAFFTDVDQVWYHSGVRGIGQTVDDVVSFISNLIKDTGVNRVVMAGNSAGGYASILFGVLCGADMVVAFSPQTNLLDAKNTRFKERLKKIHASTGPKHLRLRDIIRQHSPIHTDIHVHYANYFLRDRSNALDLSGLPSVTLHNYPMLSHNVAPALKKTGSLERILLSALQPNRRDATHQHRVPTRLDRLSMLYDSIKYLLSRGLG